MYVKDLIELIRPGCCPLHIEVRKGNYEVGLFRINSLGMKKIENEIIDNWFIYRDGSQMVIDLKEDEE